MDDKPPILSDEQGQGDLPQTYRLSDGTLREMDTLPEEDLIEAEKRRLRARKKMVRDLIDWSIAFLLALAAVFLLRAFVLEPIRVDGNSMQDTLQNNEYVLVTKYDYYGRGPEFFDVVLCRYPGETESYIKRVVGLPGDMVELRGGDLFVNDVKVSQDFLTRRGTMDYGPVLVPEDCYFVMGDNRPNSVDSRNAEVGPVERGNILGRAQLVIFPLSNWRTIWDLR